MRSADAASKFAVDAAKGGAAIKSEFAPAQLALTGRHIAKGLVAVSGPLVYQVPSRRSGHETLADAKKGGGGEAADDDDETRRRLHAHKLPQVKAPAAPQHASQHAPQHAAPHVTTTTATAFTTAQGYATPLLDAKELKGCRKEADVPDGAVTEVKEETYMVECEKIHMKTEEMEEVVPAQDNRFISGNDATLQCRFPRQGKINMVMAELKEDSDEDVFLGPLSVGGGTILGGQRCDIQPSPPFYTSRLRDASIRSEMLRYTPPPILDPCRRGQGLYWLQHSTKGNYSPITGNDDIGTEDDNQQESLDTSEYCVMPCPNVGPEFQCTLPDWRQGSGNNNTETDEKGEEENGSDRLLWNPEVANLCSDDAIELYLEFASSAAIPGAGCNQEYALHLLYSCGGSISDAVLKLMDPLYMKAPHEPKLDYYYNTNDKWTTEEIDIFHQGLHMYEKDFYTISQDIGSKSVKQCVQFYYMWKQLCTQEYQRLRLLWQCNSVEDVENLKTQEREPAFVSEL